STLSFIQRAQEEHVPVHVDDYTYGTHTWPYWARDLSEYLQPMMARFASAPSAPSPVSYQSVDAAWTQWGWSVSLERRAVQQFSALTNATGAGFTLHGAGLASVTTPASYTPGDVMKVTVNGTTATSASLVTVGDD